jgi:hypothetical protein
MNDLLCPECGRPPIPATLPERIEESYACCWCRRQSTFDEMRSGYDRFMASSGETGEEPF